MADYVLSEMIKRGAQSWTSPDPALRCGIATVTVAPVKMPDLEKSLWKEKKIRIRGAAPHKIRLSTPYYLLRKDVDRFLSSFDEYKKVHAEA
jgi:isopenicillin-N epimerase